MSEQTVSQDELQAMMDRGEVACGWFALCENPAVKFEPHPVLELVPICERCAAKVAALQ